MSDKTVSAVPTETDAAYREFEQQVANAILHLKGPLFTTDASGLFEAYLDGLPVEKRQHYNCHCCRRFIERYGGLVGISEDGTLWPAIWGKFDAPDFFIPAVVGVLERIVISKITGVFLSQEAVWGTPVTGVWTHLSGPSAMKYDGVVLSAAQKMAEKKQDYITLRRALGEIPREAVVQAVRVLEADAVDRSEKTLGCAQWLLGLYGKNTNQIWLAVATAPPGWCHVKRTMIGTLIDDIIAGLPYESIKNRWAQKMHPLQYQRPSTVTDGQLTQANKVVEQLASAGALKRRFARLEDVKALWKPLGPVQFENEPGKPFDHLRKNVNAIKPVDLPPQTVRWPLFRELLLPYALQIDMLAPPAGPYYGLVTAADPEAPLLFQWDSPVSWYFYHGGSLCSHWSLEPGWVPVTAVFLKPCFWTDETKHTHQGPGVFFALRGAWDTRHRGGGSFFPECLKSEYHGVRHAMEAYARGAEIAGKEEGTANGLALQEKGVVQLRVDGVRYNVTLE